MVTPILKVNRVSKTFPGVNALKEASIEFYPGEIHSIVGENGAGKSTLVKIVSGFEQADSGTIEIDGQPMAFKTPKSARSAGVTYVPQTAEGVPNFTVGRNVLLGQTRGWANRNKMSARESRVVQEALEKMGVGWLTGNEYFKDLPVAEVRLCQIAGALASAGRLIVLDEPTAVLSDTDAATLIERVDELRRGDKSVIYISHRLNEIMEISDRITVLRDGAVIGTYRRGEVSREQLIDEMARIQINGTDKKNTVHRTKVNNPSTSKQIFSATGITCNPFFKEVNVQVRAGEVIGIAGIQGSGHTRIAEALAGVLPVESGEIAVDDRIIETGSTKSALKAGVRLVPADRREQGIVGCRSVIENIVIGLNKYFFRRPQLERQQTLEMVQNLDIHTPGLGTPAEKLSGGNQQKVVIARMIGTDPRVLILSEPTQGIDVRAKAQILELLRSIAKTRGIGIIISSSEFEELIDYTDRIYVMKTGNICGEHQAKDLSYNALLHEATP